MNMNPVVKECCDVYERDKGKTFNSFEEKTGYYGIHFM